MGDFFTFKQIQSNAEQPSCGCCVGDLHIDAQGEEHAQNLKQSRRMLLHSCKSTPPNGFSPLLKL